MHVFFQHQAQSALAWGNDDADAGDSDSEDGDGGGAGRAALSKERKEVEEAKEQAEAEAAETAEEKRLRLARDVLMKLDAEQRQNVSILSSDDRSWMFIPHKTRRFCSAESSCLSRDRYCCSMLSETGVPMAILLYSQQIRRHFLPQCKSCWAQVTCSVGQEAQYVGVTRVQKSMARCADTTDVHGPHVPTTTSAWQYGICKTSTMAVRLGLFRSDDRRFSCVFDRRSKPFGCVIPPTTI